jgi:hypothetical protein
MVTCHPPSTDAAAVHPCSNPDGQLCEPWELLREEAHAPTTRAAGSIKWAVGAQRSSVRPCWYIPLEWHPAAHSSRSRCCAQQRHTAAGCPAPWGSPLLRLRPPCSHLQALSPALQAAASTLAVKHATACCPHSTTSPPGTAHRACTINLRTTLCALAGVGTQHQSH